jgi:hypothetical protein
LFLLLLRGPASADDSYTILLPFGVKHHQQISEIRPPDTEKPVFTDRVVRVRNRQFRGIGEYSDCFGKADSMFFIISFSLSPIPLKFLYSSPPSNYSGGKFHQQPRNHNRKATGAGRCFSIEGFHLDKTQGKIPLHQNESGRN